MNIFIILLLSLDLRRVAYGFNQPGFITDNSQGVEMVVLSDLGSDKCPKIVQPLCATNGKDFLYFQNKCHMEVKNYEFLTRGLLEYFECPPIFCQTDCPNCEFINEPVCAVDVLTGERKLFDNSCEVERTMCTTKQAWTMVDIKECVMNLLTRAFKPLNNILQDPECPVLCPLDYRPICARFMNLEKEYANECELKATICRSQQVWHVIRQGPCQPPNFNAATHILAQESKCSKICPNEYKPICAKFHNELRVFDNRCELENIICQFGHNWQVIKEGHCLEDHKSSQQRECPEFCLNEHEPVCARFGEERKEFRNLCELLKAKCITNINWEILNLGPCITNSKQLLLPASKCPQTCAKSYKPVCAKFKWKLKEFRNQCELEKTICDSNTDWKLFKQGRCPLAIELSPTCPKICTKEFKPVCASYNGQHREFFNSCELEKTACETSTGWKLMKSGPCPILSSNTFNNSSECPKLCPKEYKMVCAEFKSKLREFDNKCEMQKSICENNTNWQLLKTGRCPLNTEIKGHCARICAQEFSPVCARFNGKLREFFNSCELEKIACKTNTNWEVLNRGPCFVNQFKRLVENSCENEIMDPVCAIHDDRTKTFDNVCQLAIEIERSGKIWYILYRGACSDTTSSATDNLDKNEINNSVSKWATATNVSNISTIPATTTSDGKHIEEEGSLKEDSHISGKTEIYDEEVEEDENDEDESETFFSNSEEHYRDDDADYDLSSYDENILSSEDDETVRHWANAQINTSNSNENHSDDNNDCESLQISDTPPSKDYVKTKNATFNYVGYSQEDNASEEINFEEIHHKTNSTKSSENFSEQCEEANRGKSKEETVHQNNMKDVTNRDSEKENKYYPADTESKGKNFPDTNFPENYLHEQNLKNAPLNDIQQNLKANITLNNSYMPEKSYKATTALYAPNKQDLNTNNESSSDYPATTNDVKSDAKDTNSKKGEIYNGIVYKAPIYDAPTYNFIYTAPVNYPGFDLHHADQNKTFAKQTKSESPFHPLHFFSSLAGTPNSMSLPQTNHETLKQILSYGQRIVNNEKPPKTSITSATLTTSLPTGSFPFNVQPTPVPPSSQSHYSSPSLTQPFATPLNKLKSKQNSTLLNEIINTLKSLTNQV